MFPRLSVTGVRMAAEKCWAACECFEQKHIYLRSLDCGKDICEEASYVDYRDDEQFSKEYRHLLKNYHFDGVLEEVKKEVERRRNRFRVMADNRLRIKNVYVPKYKELFDASKLPINDVETVNVRDGIFSFPLLDESVCNIIMEELENFKKNQLPHSRPNSMIKSGVILEEVGLDKIVEAIREKIEPVAREKYPDLVGDTGLDSAKAFTIDYDAENEATDKELATHFDNSEVTVNVSLTSGHVEGELYFLQGHGRVWPVQHRRGWAILHRGSALHGAMPVTEGCRTNLIIWFRSSAVRNRHCPMCGEPPRLKEVRETIEIEDQEETKVCSWRSHGDGFTV